jgi:hypothetical protein
MDFVPIWIVTRNVPAQGLGGIGNRLIEFAHLQVPPLRKSELRMLLEKAASSGMISLTALKNLDGIYRLCRGNPSVIENLLSDGSRCPPWAGRRDN